MPGAFSFNSATVVATNRHNIYNALPLKTTHTVRLLTLKKASSQRDRAALAADLFVADLDDVHGQFEALSYTWGNQPFVAHIRVNGHILLIPQSLYEFLARLRDMGVACALWADAICMDQHNKLEKNHQIRLMSTIYSAASCVRIWLGEQSKGLATCIDAHNDAGDLEWGNTALASIRQKPHGILDSILQHNYWTRTWILQEVILAQTVVVHASQCAILWDEFVHMTKRLCAKAGMQYLNLLGRSTLMHLHEQRISQASQALPQLLQKYRQMACVNLRDRVFGLVGLINVESDPLRPRVFCNELQHAAFNALFDYTLALPELFARLLQFYSVSATDDFAFCLWQAFELETYRFDPSHLEIPIRLPIQRLKGQGIERPGEIGFALRCFELTDWFVDLFVPHIGSDFEDWLALRDTSEQWKGEVGWKTIWSDDLRGHEREWEPLINECLKELCRKCTIGKYENPHNPAPLYAQMPLSAFVALSRLWSYRPIKPKPLLVSYKSPRNETTISYGDTTVGFGKETFGPQFMRNERGRLDNYWMS